ncbi:MAG: nuclear transport factor 2 family protein [Proteobacteria bacterium]|nr:nuclear transport factor 2 family protein [Pseudomonadota bacterium]
MSRLSLSLTALLLAAPAFGAGPSASEQAVWSLEDSYWHYVRDNDLEHYRTLWHRDFLGWPLSSPEPVHKEHITDWIALHTGAGEALKSYELERLAAQENGACVTVAYRVRMVWAAKDGSEKPGALRVIHSWMRQPGGQWQIISGMAAPPDARGH